MNILIADDEYLARASLRSMLTELGMDINIVGEACDGEELVQKVLKTHPDLVYVDIKMPKLDGLNAIKRIKEQCANNTEWIILTGFPVFEYAKESIELQVKEYLLKPVSKKELKKSIENILAKRAERQQKLNLEFEHDISALMNKYMTLDDLSYNNIILSYHFIGAILLLDSFPDDGKSAKLQQNFLGFLSDMTDKFMDSETRLTFIPLPDGNFSAIFAWNASIEEGCRNKSGYFVGQLINIAKRISACHYCETVIYGSECDNFLQLSEQINQMQKLIPQKIRFSYAESISLKDLMTKYKSSTSQAIKISELIYNATDLYKSCSYYEYIKSIDSLKFYLSANNLGLNSLAPFIEFLQCSYGIDLSSANSLASFYKIMIDLAEKRLNMNISAGDMVDKTICYINSYYMDDIGIAQIANLFNVTPNYLSALFHKKTGENFISYLTKTRMTKARELIMSSENPNIGRISKQVGYYTVSYFTKVYKRYYGLSPSQDFSSHKTSTLI